MPSDHKKQAIKTLRHRYGEAWGVKNIPVGIELQREVSLDLTQHVFFNFVRDDALGLRVQPALGVKFAVVNAARDAISPRHEYTADPVTGLVFLNSLIEAGRRQNGGWLFESNKPLQPAFDHFLDFVDDTVSQTGFFESLQTINDYITAVESGPWEFVTVAPIYLYALIAVGRITEAKKLAARHRAQEFEAAAEHGRVPHESNIQPYDEILEIQG